MRTVRSFTAVAALALAMASAPAEAAVRLGLGGDWSPSYGGEFNLTLGVDARIARQVAIGGRFGGMVTASALLGAPIDFELRVDLGRVYVGGLLGPWLVFDAGFPIRLHGAFEFGLEVGNLSFGLELGYLHPSAIGGLRVAFRI
jgi:hypothetical protein